MSWICSHASTSILDVRIEGPLAHAPRLYRTKTFRIISWHGIRDEHQLDCPVTSQKLPPVVLLASIQIWCEPASSCSFTQYPVRVWGIQRGPTKIRRCDVSTIPLKGRKHETNIIVRPLTADSYHSRRRAVLSLVWTRWHGRYYLDKVGRHFRFSWGLSIKFSE